jgi:predicted O-linked N-acetylglucosamine transferase (SPINDLY family)
VNLGTAYHACGELDQAVACFRRALEIEPDHFDALRNLGSALRRQGRIDEAIACHQRASQVSPNNASAHSVTLALLHYRTGVGLATLAAAHAQYDRRHAAPLRSVWKNHENLRDPDRPLRLGFVSADLVRHPVGYFLIPVLENLDRRAFASVCYGDQAASDDVTARFRRVTAAWHDVRAWSDEQLAGQIRDDRIDILFDLAGHTMNNRLLAFARKPAPIQITWLGYVGSTGLSAMDYLLADRHEVPPEAEPHYRERVLRLPDSSVCFEGPAEAPPVGRLPALDSGRFTFACFNNPIKISDVAIGLWSRILGRTPRSRLLLKYWGLHAASVQAWFRSRFAEQGVDAERVEFEGWSARGELLGRYGQVDLALDPFPHSGGATTCDALWMGVPVITLPGETFASRQTLSYVSTVGLTETVARDRDEYVEIAVRLANDLPRLAEIRAALRDQMAGSPLCGGKRFAENLATLLRGVWREWCMETPGTSAGAKR